ncbi:penicillin acylase family protein [Enemella dayhoffiae]|uniref:Penicillin acylase family protein n=1 Tax=Enemella dayhoffiae TaxID=2016507 RepID=A0A255HAK5_9ACTN|nr:penicillin acylase family protein [Enemella dayhoffiae]OYO24522.1 penicillin acylase family protein [Enemella dayhoffiae]
MRSLPRWLFNLLITLALVLAALASLAVVTVRESFPQTSGTLTLAPLSNPVTVLRDAQGVPQLYADTPEDLFAAQGFVHAQDRFFEMDFRRHVTAGRLSEWFGPSQVNTDAYVRTLGFRRVAEQEFGMLSSRGRRYLEAYTAGVNAYLSSRSATDLSIEYALLGLQGRNTTPEPWSGVDSLAWLKAMAWQLDGNLNAEVESAVMRRLVGDQRAGELRPDYDPEVFEPIVDGGAPVNGQFDPNAQAGQQRPAPPVSEAAIPALRAILAGNLQLPTLVADSASAATGSNSWVISGERSATGKPILANDPHLATSIPSIFTQVGLHCRVVDANCPFDVSGFSFAGMPGVMIGQNADIAWGMTTPYVDTQDLFIEQVRDGRVRRGEDWRPLESRTELISVAGEEPRAITVRTSSHGPLLSDVDTKLRGVPPAPATGEVESAVALGWTALTPGASLDAVFGVNEARNFTEFRQAAEKLKAPSQNLVYADRQGNIGYQLPGDLPRRGQGDGTSPVPGWDPAYAWQGRIPFAELPYSYNPPRGYLVAANQQIIANYPGVLGTDPSMGWRSQQIGERINAHHGPITLAETQDIFTDTRVRFADRIVPALLRVPPAEDWVRDGQQVLRDWDLKADPDSAGTLYFQLVMKHLLRLTLDDELPPELRTGSSDRWYAVVAELIRDPRNRWWDDQRTVIVEDRDSIIAQAMVDARRDITVLMSRDPDGWKWGRAHRLRLQNQTFGSSGVGLLEALFNRGNEPVGGGTAIVEAFGFDDRKWGFEVTSGPTMRMAVDLADPDRSRWVNQSGQSGHIFHPHYDDQLRRLARNDLAPWPCTPDAVQAAAVDRLELTPGN